MDIPKGLVAASATPLVLTILAEGDSYGYAIIKRVGELSCGRARMDGGAALPAAPPPRTPRPGRGHVGHLRDGAQAQVLPAHGRRASALAEHQTQWRTVSTALEAAWAATKLDFGPAGAFA